VALPTLTQVKHWLCFFKRKPRYILVLMDEQKIKQINALYEELRGLVFGLGDVGMGQNIVGGPASQYKQIIKKLSEITGEDFSRFLPKMDDYDSNDPITGALDLKTSVNSLIASLRANYLNDRPAHYEQSASASTEVNVNVTVSVVVDILNILNEKEKEFEEGTKERTFIEKLKSGLKGVKDTASILSTIAQTANQVGLTTAELMKILS